MNDPLCALKKLVAEVTDLHIKAVRESLGNTNAAVLKLRRDEAEAVIAAHDSGDGGKQ